MNIGSMRGKMALVLGDVGILLGSLLLALIIRYQVIPTGAEIFVLIQSFAPVIMVWLIILYIAGLYDRFAFDFKKRVFSILTRAQIANGIVAVLYFYILDTAVNPKTILFIYVVLASFFILLWRVFAFPMLYRPSRIKAVLICAGKPLQEMAQALTDKKYGIQLVRTHDLVIETITSLDLRHEIEQQGIEMVIFDYQHPHAQEMIENLYPLIFKGVGFVQFEELYEMVFSRISIDHLSPEWFSQNTYSKNTMAYMVAKRIMDCVIAVPLLIVTGIFFPIIVALIKWDSAGDAFIYQERIGKNGNRIRIPKFRSMTVNDQGVWVNTAGDARITRVGSFLRKSRIDELPQLWSVIKGDLSLVGPRPDIIGLGIELEKTVPFYTVRNLVVPGLSGWAQISQDLPPQSLEETIVRLSYDLYYVKHRSVLLDLEIALKTVRILLSRMGA
ncbi:MAG: sugar transferase [bacterium]